MRVTLLLNPASGTAEPEEVLIEELAAVGWRVVASGNKEKLEELVVANAEAMVVAGGDGLVAAAARRLAGSDRPMAVIPAGTINNVARSLGIGIDPHAAVAALARVQEKSVDMGVLSNDGTEVRFLEGFGMGVFAYVMGEKATKKHKAPRKGLALLAEQLEDYQPRALSVHADGRDLSGEFIMVSLLNTKSIGPALSLAPDARCDDGELDLVLVRPEARAALVAHVRRAAKEGDVALPAFETVRAKNVTIDGGEGWAHVDDRAVELGGHFSLTVHPGAVRMIVPQL